MDDLVSASDTSLVMGISRKREEALAEAYRRHGGVALALANRILHDIARAEEIVQDIFVHLWNSPEKFDPERGTLRTYVLAKCHSRSIDRIRSEKSRTDREMKVGKEAPLVHDFDREIVDLTTAEQVKQAMGNLNDGERSAIELAYFGGQTYREVAQTLGEPEGTIKSRIRMGLTKLRGDLAHSGVNYE